MKLFNVFLIFSFFFFISCGDGGVTRVVEEENHETVNDNDPTNPTDDPTNPTDDPTNPTDDPTNPTDDPTNPTDDPTNPTDDPTNPTDDPTNPTDDPTNPTDDPTNPTDDPTNPTDNPTNPTDDPTVEPGSDEAKCVAAGGTWDAFADDDMERCYKIVDCAPKPENTEWIGEQSWLEYYDVEDGQWTNFGQNYKTEYNDSGEPKICQYICTANTVREDNECKPLCSAVFNGESSRIEVADNDLLNPGSDSWTIEAWIKQDEGDLTSDYTPILRKGTSENPPYVLTGYRKQQSWGNVTYTVTGATTYKSVMGSSTENLQVDGTFDEFSGGWTHVALVHNKKVEGALIQSTTYKITLYVNGKQVNSKTYEPRTTMNLLEVNEPLIIGANLYSSWTVSKKYFKGLIDSIRISGSERYTADFTPSQLSVDNDTIAFWDFSNDAKDSSENALDGSGTNVTYSTDCAF